VSTDGSVLRAAAVQLTSTADRARNLAAADRLVREAARRGAELVVLPEKWSVLGTPAQTAAGAEELDGPALSWARSVAAELGIDLIAGSIAERGPSDDPDVRGPQHLRPRPARTGRTWPSIARCTCSTSRWAGSATASPATEQPGDEVVVTRTAGGVEVGMSICYDLRFPELYRILAVRGARVLAVPAAFTLATTREHWEVLLRARAIEDQCFVVAANQVGEHAAGYRSGGRSMIVDPWGVVLGQAPDAEAIVYAELDLARQAEVRRTLPSLANRRPEAYAWPEALRA
jgi:predicted amidohydrolase